VSDGHDQAALFVNEPRNKKKEQKRTRGIT
jgi:hypothetical protein